MSFAHQEQQQQQQHWPRGGSWLHRFQVTKLRSWRTGYERLLCLDSTGFCTLDPWSGEETNRWPYSALSEWLAVPNESGALLLQVGADRLKFACHGTDRSTVLTCLLQCQDEAGQARQQHAAAGVFASCERYTRHGTRVPVVLQALPYGLAELDAADGGGGGGRRRRRLQVYLFKDVRAVSLASDSDDGVLLHFHRRKTRLYLVHAGTTTGGGAAAGRHGRSQLVTTVRELCGTLGLSVQMEQSQTVQQWLHNRVSVNVGTVASRWSVTKASARRRQQGAASRQLAITGAGYLVELDAANAVVNCNLLTDIQSIVRPYEQSNLLVIEYTDGSSRTYASAERDALAVSLLDAAPTPVSVTDVSSVGYCLANFYKRPGERTLSKEEQPHGVKAALFQPMPVPVYTLKRIHEASTRAYAFVTGEMVLPGKQKQQQAFDMVAECATVQEACRQFNASVLPTGEELVVPGTDKNIVGSLGALWGLVRQLLAPSSSKQSDDHHRRVQNERIACTFFQSLYRLSRTGSGFRSSSELTTLLDCIPYLFTIQDVFCKFWAFSTLRVLLSGKGSKKKRDMETEYVNKNVILKTGGPAMVDGLVSALLPSETADPHQKVSDLLLMVTSDILQNLLCSYYDTTSPEHFQAFIGALANRYRALLSTLRSHTPFVLENTALLLHLLSTHAPMSAAAIREAALSSAIVLQHFYSAIFSPLEGQRFLSRYLCSLWLSGPMDCEEKRLLKRMVPHGFLSFLDMPPLSRMEEDQLEDLERDALEENIPDVTTQGEEAVAEQGAAGTNTARLRTRIERALATAAAKGQDVPRQENFRIFFHVLTQDHSLPDLIWSQQTRRELRIALKSELEYIRRETDARGVDAIAWNHQQFQVPYPSLENEVKVGNIYMRLWLQAGDGFIRSWEEPVRLFEHLFRRFLCEVDRNAKVTVMCVRCLERLYAIHASKIGPFPDVMILVRSMASTKSVETQHHLLGLLVTVLGVPRDDDHQTANIPENAEQLLNMESIEQLCQFVAWGHTNSDQIGNVLTRVLSASKNGRHLITDGTGSGPEGDGKETKPCPAGDSSCPAVWFVASTRKIPPPQESIQGPFRVSDLVRQMDEGNLSPYDLVTSSHVEEYDTDDVSETVQEAQIDTGKWKRLNEVWQLRWQLCTDGSAAVYTQSDVALLALKALTRLVDLHRSLDSRGVPFVPIPIAKRILCGADVESSLEGGSSIANPLAIVVQSLLCNDGRIVEQAADLLYKLSLYNERSASKLYLTGVFFFACGYTGSNFKALAKLIHATHLVQMFRSGFAAAADESELPMKDRSFLGHAIPEGLLFILTNYGSDRFADVFVGNWDTPEVIWTFDMRKHLIEMIRQHLGDFPLRLFQNTTTEYEYCPMPGISYKRLEKEIFCHNYYLRNLCDEVRFPDWPIAEPVEVFRSCLEHFKKQLDRDEIAEEEALEKARNVLSLEEGDGGKELRRSYRKLARKYHPDKNPAGRDMFEAIQTSYEVLLPIVDRGEKIRVYSQSLASSVDDGGVPSEEGGFPSGIAQMQTMHLLIKAQLMICRRYEKEMSRHNYPAYSILLGCITLPPSLLTEMDEKTLLESAFAQTERAELFRTSVELLFRTCLISPLNSEELVAKSGVTVLSSILAFYAKLASVKKQAKMENTKVASEEIIADIISHTIHTLAGVAFYESGRDAIKLLPKAHRFLLNWRRCLDGSLFQNREEKVYDASIKRYAIEGITNMAKDDDLQQDVVGYGMVWPLLRYALLFDPTLDQTSGSNEERDDIGLSVASINVAARLSIRALGMLSGLVEEAPPNAPLADALTVLLTPPVAKMLRNKRTGAILKILNANVERADIIWNIHMRNQLESLLTEIEKERPEDCPRSITEELGPAILNFRYDELKNEVRIGGVWVRVFNKSGKEALSHIENPNTFLEAVMDFVARSLNEAKHFKGWVDLATKKRVSEGSGSDEVVAMSAPLDSNSFLLAMNSLRILCRVDGLVDDVLYKSPNIVPSVLLSLLELPVDSEAFDIGSDILFTLSPKHTFADAVTKENSLWRLVQLLERSEISEKSGEDSASADAGGSERIMERKARGWAVLEALSSSPSIATEILSSSGWIELLGVLVGYTEFTKLWTARLGAAKTLSRLLWDPKTGPLAESLLLHFLPASHILGLKENPEMMLKNFDGSSDTPELIWDSSMRGELRKKLGAELDVCVKKRVELVGAYKNFSLRPEARVRYTKLENELYIGGVYVSRFLKEPSYNLRDPTTFLELLLQRWTKELEMYVSKDEPGTPDVGAIAEAGQDILQIVTTASVYLCKVRDSLCDRLAPWGYMSRSVYFLDKVLGRDLKGTPLLSVIRLLHVAADRMANVEALAVAGQSDGIHGVLGFTLRSIKSESLHPDSGFMIEFLNKMYTRALGDVSKARPHGYMPSGPPHPSTVFMAPSPAPGEGPVRKKVGLGDDPLAMMLPATEQVPSTQPAGIPAPQSTMSHGAGWADGGHSTAQSAPVQGAYQPAVPQQSTLQYGTGGRQSVTPAGPVTGQRQYAYQRHQAMQMSYGVQPAPTTYGAQRHPQSSTTSFAQRSQILQQQACLAGQTPGLQRASSPPYSIQQPAQNVSQQQPQYYQQQNLLSSTGEATNPSYGSQGQQTTSLQRSEISETQQYTPQPADGTGQRPQAAGYSYSQVGQPPAGVPSALGYGQQGRLDQRARAQSPAGTSFQYHDSPRSQQHFAQHPQGMPHQQAPSPYGAQGMQQTSSSAGQLAQQQYGQQHMPVVQQGMQGFSTQQQTAPAPPPAPHHGPQVPVGATSYGAGPGEYQQPPPQGNALSQQQGSAMPHPPVAYHQDGLPVAASNFPQDHPEPSGAHSVMGGTPHPNAPFVETVPEPVPVPERQYRPTPMEGSGIDARTPADPKVAAEQQATASVGAPGCARGRVALLQQALACKLCEFLINDVLESTDLPNVRDPAAAKVHSIDLLKLLRKDPGFGPTFKLILDDIPAWKKYKSQDHSLLITGHKQKADYFLTDGGSGKEMKLLTEG